VVWYAGVRDDSFEDVVLQDASAIQDSMESGSVGSLAFPLEKLQASIGGPRNGLQKVPEDEREAQSPTTPLGRVITPPLRLFVAGNTLEAYMRAARRSSLCDINQSLPNKKRKSKLHDPTILGNTHAPYHDYVR
jgi:hypothetical protein